MYIHNELLVLDFCVCSTLQNGIDQLIKAAEGATDTALCNYVKEKFAFADKDVRTTDHGKPCT